jgi:Putative beta barrel porin-7 (BBP7)
MRGWIVGVSLALLAGAGWVIGQGSLKGPETPPALPPTDMQLAMPPVPPVPDPPPHSDVTDWGAMPSSAPKLFPESVPVPHPYLKLPPLPPVPRTPPLPAFVNGQTTPGQAAGPSPPGHAILTGHTDEDPATLPPTVIPTPPGQGPPPPFWDCDGPIRENGGCVQYICTPEPRFWAQAEYLLWFFEPGSAPPLLAAFRAPTAGQPVSAQGAVLLFPTGGFNDGPASGVRGTLGMWFDNDQNWGAEASYFWLPEETTGEQFSSSGGVLLARPFFDLLREMPVLRPVSLAGQFSGSSRVDTSIDFQGGELNLLKRGHSIFSDHVEFLAGFRYLNLGEHLCIEDSIVSRTLGASSSAFDAFETRNQFYGGQVGVRFNFTEPRWVADLSAKVAYGAINQSVRIDGATRADLVGLGTFALPGNTLTATSNIGDFSRTRSAFVPELTLNFGYRITPNAVFFVGYNFMLITDVVRAGSQIDPGVNPALLPFHFGPDRPLRPTVPFHSEDFWAQGLNFGLALRY